MMKKLIYIIFIFIYLTTNLYSQNKDIKKGIEFAFLYYNKPAINLGYVRQLNWPLKEKTFITNGAEIIFTEEKSLFLLTSRFNFSLFQTKNGFNINAGFSLLLFPEFLYSNSEYIVDFGIKPELTIGYKNLSIGYQYNKFCFYKTTSILNQHSIVIYYKIFISK